VKTFQCSCTQSLFFHDFRCASCGAETAYDPTSYVLADLRPVDGGAWTMASDSRRPAPRFRFCNGRSTAAGCNWLIPADETNGQCLSCRLTRAIPDLSRPRNATRLAALEAAKRDLLFSLQSWGLPIDPKTDEEPGGLAFDFLESIADGPQVLTGHADGLITINVAEADSDYREKHREALKEPYRTVLGHLRHEVGHYYWNVLIRDTDWHDRCRQVFGDERADYGEALQRNYTEGPPVDWVSRCISSYAASHPWEDWAESWAHYMHIRETSRTAASYGLDISRARVLVTPFAPEVLYDPKSGESLAFLEWVNAWRILTAVLNETARSMGQPDIYPFELTGAVVGKLSFIHEVVADCAANGHVQRLSRRRLRTRRRFEKRARQRA
jgi:hypothetical protein